MSDIAAILDTIPADTGLTEDEVRLEVAIKIMENFPRGIQGDVDADLAQAVELAREAGVYLGGTVHPETCKRCARRLGTLPVRAASPSRT